MYEIIKAAVAAWVLTVQPVLYNPGENPETTDEREERITMAAETAVDAVAQETTGFKSDQAVALVLSVWLKESAFEHNVHAGLRTHIGTQDEGKAKCLGQIRTWPGNTLLTRERWKALVGTSREATMRCAAATLSYLWYHAARCLRPGVPLLERWDEPLTDHEAEFIFASYGRGRCSRVSIGSRARLQAYRRILRFIKKERVKRERMEAKR